MRWWSLLVTALVVIAPLPAGGTGTVTPVTTSPGSSALS